MTTHYPGPTPADLGGIPAALKALPQWVLWRGSDRLDKQTGAIVGLDKVPYTTDPDKKADTSDPGTWSTFERCVAALPVALEDWELASPAGYRGGGLGVVLTEKDPLCGVDMDHSVAPDGTIAPWAQAIVKDLDSYTQRSCSGTGLHVIIKGKLPPDHRQAGNLQMWDERRFFAMTGWHLPGTPRTVEPRQGPLEALWCTHFGAKVGDLVHCIDASGSYTTPQPVAIERIEAAPDGQPFARFPGGGTGWPLARCVPVPVVSAGQCISPPMPDDEVLQRARQATNGAKFATLWAGRWQALGLYSSESEADSALLSLLAFWTQDVDQLRRLFEQSALCDQKWLSRPDYQQRTLAYVLGQMTTYYQPVTTLTVNGSQNGTTPQASVDESIPLSDVYNAWRLAADHGIDLRYCFPWKAWLTWEGTHWHKDDSGEAMRRARNTVKHIIQDGRNWLERLAAEMEEASLAQDSNALKNLKEQQKQANALFAHGAQSLADARLNAMLHQAQSWEGMPVPSETLDADRWLLNCANGTLPLKIDPQQGAQMPLLRPHQREDYLTCCLPVAYDQAAACPVWDAFLWRIMGGSGAWSYATVTVPELKASDDQAVELIGFLQRAVGWALTGDTSEECFFLLHGPGRNGKSKFLGALLDLFGAYGLNTQAETFVEQSRNAGGSGATPDVARLRNARLVTVIESAEGSRLNERLISQVTGRDRVTARFLYQESFEFTPQFKLFYACNHLPKITSQNTAMWRRIRHVPFSVTIPEAERDMHLDEKLRAELPGILAWAVRGCVAWQRTGLKPPTAVLEATEAYRHEQDLVQRFLDDACHLGPSFETKAGVLFAGFRQWCQENHERDMSMKEFGKRLDGMGYGIRKSNGVHRQGIGLDAAYAPGSLKVSNKP